MTARDEAINAMYDLPGPPPLFHKDFGRLIDAVPGLVLVQLAIERGALEVAMVPGAKFTTFAADEVLLRLVSP